MIDKETLFYGSFSSEPGSLGCKRFNTAFQRNGINAIYKSFGVDNIQEAFNAAATLGFNGFAVSMPYKYEAALLCTEIDEISRACRSVNCVKVVEDKAMGYNTDVIGIRTLAESMDLAWNKVTILGTGAFARTACYVFSQMGKLCRYLPRQVLEEDEHCLAKVGHELIFNATPLKGLAAKIPYGAGFIDCDPESETGRQMSFYSARAQFFDVYGFDHSFIFEEVV